MNSIPSIIRATSSSSIDAWPRPPTRPSSKSKYEAEFAHNPTYIHMYRYGHAYHGVHPFYMWYWGEPGRQHVGPRDRGGMRGAGGGDADGMGSRRTRSMKRSRWRPREHGQRRDDHIPSSAAAGNCRCRITETTAGAARARWRADDPRAGAAQAAAAADRIDRLPGQDLPLCSCCGIIRKSSASIC